MTVRPCGGQRMGICEVGSNGRPIAGKLKPVTFGSIFGARLQAPSGTPVETSRAAAAALKNAVGAPPQDPANPYFRPV